MAGTRVAAPGKRNGPAPIPNEVKRRRGNPGKRALPKEGNLQILPGSKTAPPPPRPLGEAGMSLWTRTWEAGYTWISPQSDVDALLLACENADEQAFLRQLVLEGGDPSLRNQLRALEKQMITLYSLLGFTPTARTALGVAEVRVEDDLEAFRRRAASR